MPKIPRWWVLCLAAALGGCGPSAFLRARMGSPRPARPPDCEVHFAYRSMEELPPRGAEKLGIVGVELSDDHWTDSMKATVRPLVCELGGNLALISMVGVNALSGAKGTNVEVYRAASAPRVKSRAASKSTTTVSL
jgi:hypothetical protein